MHVHSCMSVHHCTQTDTHIIYWCIHIVYEVYTKRIHSVYKVYTCMYIIIYIYYTHTHTPSSNYRNEYTGTYILYMILYIHIFANTFVRECVNLTARLPPPTSTTQSLREYCGSCDTHMVCPTIWNSKDHPKPPFWRNGWDPWIFGHSLDLVSANYINS